MERFTADNIFRDKLNGFSISKSQLFADYGIVIDPQEILPLWNYKTYNEQKQDWPLANLYRSFIDDLHKYRSLVRDQVNMSIICPRFHSWRQRQIARCSSEMPASSNANTYPIIAFELSQGCSMGCWFCGVSAEKFEEGFILKNRWVEHKSIGSSLIKQFGELVATGKYTANELKNNLISKGYEPFQVFCILQDFFDNGMLNDEHILYE